MFPSRSDFYVLFTVNAPPGMKNITALLELTLFDFVTVLFVYMGETCHYIFICVTKCVSYQV